MTLKTLEGPAEAPRNAARVAFTLDGKELSAPEGTLLIDAAGAAGVEIPHYCYHPALGNPGVCRLCMVEVEGMPKLQVSCRLGVKAGMAARSDSESARRAQASSLELHLVNHPLDCPVCDQAGECRLQDYYMRFGGYAGALREDKEHKRKRLEIGPGIMLDSERCILCTRCTRFLDDITRTHELGIFHSGSRSELLPVPGKSVDNPYAGNVVDLCPVGALTDRHFRFQVRAWYLERTPSVCPGCARGCSTEIHSNTQRPWHGGGRRVVRLVPRHNPAVNAWWICDEGRYGCSAVDSPGRLKAVSVLEGGKLSRLSWESAVPRLARELREGIERRGAAGLAVILSATLSNEDLHVAKKLFKDALKVGHLLLRPGPDQLGEEDALLRRREKVPNWRGAQAMGFGAEIVESSWEDIAESLDRGALWGLYVVDRDPLALWPRAAAGKLAELPLSVYHGTHSNRFTASARWVLPSACYAEEEGTFTNFQGHVQRFRRAVPPLGDSRPEWSLWRGLLHELGLDFPQDSAAAIFGSLCSKEAAFRGMDWEGLGRLGARLP